jgi:hypothetical protein
MKASVQASADKAGEDTKSDSENNTSPSVTLAAPIGKDTMQFDTLEAADSSEP